MAPYRKHKWALTWGQSWGTSSLESRLRRGRGAQGLACPGSTWAQTLRGRGWNSASPELLRPPRRGVSRCGAGAACRWLCGLTAGGRWQFCLERRCPPPRQEKGGRASSPPHCEVQERGSGAQGLHQDQGLGAAASIFSRFPLSLRAWGTAGGDGVATDARPAGGWTLGPWYLRCRVGLAPALNSGADSQGPEPPACLAWCPCPLPPLPCSSRAWVFFHPGARGSFGFPSAHRRGSV